MTGRQTHAIRPRIEIFLWRQGWVWPLAALLALVAAVEYFALLQPARSAYESAAKTSRAPAVRVPVTVTTRPAQDDSAALEDLTRRLVPRSDAAEVVQSMTALAKQYGVSIPSSDYQRRVSPALGITQIQVSQATKTSYPQLRRYIEAVLLAHPSASLDQVVVKRESVMQTQPEARLRWSISLRAGQAAGSAAVQEHRQ